MDPVLADYARNVPDARESEVLSLYATIINKWEPTFLFKVLTNLDITLSYECYYPADLLSSGWGAVNFYFFHTVIGWTFRKNRYLSWPLMVAYYVSVLYVNTPDFFHFLTTLLGIKCSFSPLWAEVVVNIFNLSPKLGRIATMPQHWVGEQTQSLVSIRNVAFWTLIGIQLWMLWRCCYNVDVIIHEELSWCCWGIICCVVCDRYKAAMIEDVPRIFEAVFQCTLEVSISYY